MAGRRTTTTALALATLLALASSIDLTGKNVEYIRFSRAGNQQHIGFQEVQVFNVAGNNLAAGCAVTAATAPYQGQLSYAVDGQYQYVNSNNDLLINRYNNNWIELDLQGEYASLNTLKLYVDYFGINEDPSQTTNWYPGDTITFMDGARDVQGTVTLPATWYLAPMPYVIDLKTASPTPSSSATSSLASPSYTANNAPSGTVRYLRMEGTQRPGQSDEYYFQGMQELQLWTPGESGTNVALSSTVTYHGTFIWGSAAGFIDDLYNPSSAVDAYENLMYSNDPPKWVEFDLGSSKVLSKLVLFPNYHAYDTNSWGDNYRPGGNLTFLDDSRNVVLQYTLPSSENFWNGRYSYVVNLAPLLAPSTSLTGTSAPTPTPSSAALPAWGQVGRNPQHTGVSPYVGPSSFSTLWSANSGGYIKCAPVVDGAGNMYIGLYGGKNAVVSYDGAGNLRWTFTTSSWVWGLALSTDGTHVLFGDQTGKVRSISSTDASVQWSYQYPAGGVYSAPSISGGVMFLGIENSMMAFSESTGAVKWTLDRPGQCDSTPALSLDGTVLYFGDNSGLITAAAASSGEVLWSYSTGAAVQSPPTVSSAGIFVGSGDNYVYALSSAGSLMWRVYSLYGTTGAAAVSGSTTVYFGTWSPYTSLLALNQQTGEEVWSYNVPTGVYGSLVLDAAGKLYVASSGGVMYAFAASSGEVTASFTTPGTSQLVSPVLSSAGVVFCAGNEGTVFALVTAPPTSSATASPSSSLSATPSSSPLASACGSGYPWNPVALVCPNGTVIKTITYASYGMSAGSCGSYTPWTGCQLNQTSVTYGDEPATSYVYGLCAGQQECTLYPPCPELNQDNNTCFPNWINAFNYYGNWDISCPVDAFKTFTVSAVCGVPPDPSSTPAASTTASPSSSPPPSATPSATPSPTFNGVCGSGYPWNPVALVCPNGTVIKTITYASYGMSAGSCGSYTPWTGCQLNQTSVTYGDEPATSYVYGLCAGQQECTLYPPCPELNQDNNTCFPNWINAFNYYGNWDISCPVDAFKTFTVSAVCGVPPDPSSTPAASTTASPSPSSTSSPSSSPSPSPSSTSSPSSSPPSTLSPTPTTVPACPPGYSDCTVSIAGTCASGYSTSGCGGCILNTPTRSGSGAATRTRSGSAATTPTRSAAATKTPTRSGAATRTPSVSPAGTRTPSKTATRPHALRQLVAATPSKTATRTRAAPSSSPSPTPLCAAGQYADSVTSACFSCPPGFATCGAQYSGTCAPGYVAVAATPGAPGFPGLTCGACVPVTPTTTPTKTGLPTRTPAQSTTPHPTVTKTAAASKSGTPATTRTPAATKTRTKTK